MQQRSNGPGRDRVHAVLQSHRGHRRRPRDGNRGSTAWSPGSRRPVRCPTVPPSSLSRDTRFGGPAQSRSRYPGRGYGSAAPVSSWATAHSLSRSARHECLCTPPSESGSPTASRSGAGARGVQRDRDQGIGRYEQPEVAPGHLAPGRIDLYPHPPRPMAEIPTRPRHDLVTIDAKGKLPRTLRAVRPVLNPELELGAGNVPDADEARTHGDPIELSAPNRQPLRRRHS